MLIADHEDTSAAFENSSALVRMQQPFDGDIDDETARIQSCNDSVVFLDRHRMPGGSDGNGCIAGRGRHDYMEGTGFHAQECELGKLDEALPRFGFAQYRYQLAFAHSRGCERVDKAGDPLFLDVVRRGAIHDVLL